MGGGDGWGVGEMRVEMGRGRWNRMRNMKPYGDMCGEYEEGEHECMRIGVGEMRKGGKWMKNMGKVYCLDSVAG
jgi:hypothetical protein